MKTPVIDSVRMAANDGIYPELEKITGINRSREWTEINALAELLKPLKLDYETSEKIMHQAMLATTAEGRKAFRNGFRVGVRLMVEILGTPEAPETMNQDKFSTMVKDGRDYIQIIQSVPKEKRFLLSMMADAFLNGMVAQERLMTERPSA